MSGTIDDATQGPKKPNKNNGKPTAGKIANLIKKLRKTGPLFATPLGWIIIGIVGVILFIFMLIGAISFLTTMPGMMLSKFQEFAENIGRSFESILYGEEALVTEEDQKELAEYIENMGYSLYEYGFGEKRPIEGKEDEYTIDSSYLKAYIVADNNTYKQHKTWKATLGSMARSYLGFNYPFAFGNYLVEDKNTYMYGMLNFDEGVLDGIEVEDINKSELLISVNQEFLNLTEHYYRFNTEGWSARYGKPLELLLTLHLVTMAPDLAYHVAMDPQENTLLNIGLHKEKVNIRMDYEFITGDTSELAAIDGLSDITSGYKLSTEDMEKIVKVLNKTENESKFVEGAQKQIDFLCNGENMPKYLAGTGVFEGLTGNNFYVALKDGAGTPEIETNLGGSTPVSIVQGLSDLDNLIKKAFEENSDSEDEVIKGYLNKLKEGKTFDEEGKYEDYYTNMYAKISDLYAKDDDAHYSEEVVEPENGIYKNFRGPIVERMQEQVLCNIKAENPEIDEIKDIKQLVDLIQKEDIDKALAEDQKETQKKVEEYVRKLRDDMAKDIVTISDLNETITEGESGIHALLGKYGLNKDALETAIEYNNKNGDDQGDDIKRAVPYIQYSERHWFKDVIFESDDGSINVYEEKDGASMPSNSYIYKPSNKSDNWEAMTESEYGHFVITETPVGKVYKQTKEAVRGEVNAHTKKLFENSKYFIYDGSTKTADAINGTKNADGVRENGLKDLWEETYMNYLSNGLTSESYTEYKDGIPTGTETANHLYLGDVEENAKKAADAAVEAKQKEMGIEVFKKIDIKKNSLAAFSILENMKTEDADYILRDLKELLIELNYFEREDLRDKNKAVFTWMLPDYHPKTWPNRKYEKQNMEYGTLIRSKTSMDKILEGEMDGTDTGNNTEDNTTEDINQNSLENILFVGDSWTADSKFQKTFNNCTFKAEVGKAPSDMLGKATGVSNVKKVCIMLGLNDPSDTEGMINLINELMREYPSATVYVQGVCHVGKGYKSGSIDATKMNEMIDNYNRIVGSYCATMPTKVKFINTTLDLQDEHGYLAESYWASKSGNEGKYHLNANGVKIWVENIKKGLQGFSEEEEEMGFKPDGKVISPVTGELLEVGADYVKIKILDTDAISEYKDFLEEYKDLCQGYEIRIEGFTTQDITVDSQSSYSEKKYGDKYFVRNAYTDEERKKIEQAEKDKAEAPAVIEQDGKKYIKEGTVLGKTTENDIKIILQNREKSIVEDVETFMKVSRKKIFSDFREEYLYWLAVAAEGMDITGESTWTAVNIGDGTVTVGPGITNWCEKEFKELGYGSSYPMVVGGQYDKYMIADIYFAELEKWKNVFLEDVNNEPQKEQVVEAFTSLLYNAGSGGALYKNRISEYKEKGSVSEDVWVQAQSGKFHNGLMKRRKSEHILLTEPSSSDSASGKLTDVYSDEHKELEFSSETPFTDALDGKDTRK